MGKDCVWFLHGMDPDPSAQKTKALAEAGFEVIAHKMPSSRARLLLDPLTLIFLFLVVLSGVVSYTRLGFPSAVVTVIATIMFGNIFVKPLLLSRFLERCVIFQRGALSRHRGNVPSVAIGSSLGGAVLIELIRAGRWTGPAILLAPAHSLLMRMSGKRPIPESGTPFFPPNKTPSRVLVVHGTKDNVTPMSDSESLVRYIGTDKAKLIVVDDTHALMKAATPDALSEWIREVTSV